MIQLPLLPPVGWFRIGICQDLEEEHKSPVLHANNARQGTAELGYTLHHSASAHTAAPMLLKDLKPLGSA